MDEKEIPEEELPEEEGYKPRPAWQVWAARVGLVLFISGDGQNTAGDAEYKLAQTIAAFLGRHMEN